ncbi:NAD-dependent protein deacetylase sirtuin-2 [Lobulomyces angularis]|nr:NAD-dependent protein deacetylase sirtuin-2 [Lobulomyces angularis]
MKISTSLIFVLSSLLNLVISADGVCQPTGCHGVYTNCRKVARARDNDCNSTSSDNHRYYPCYQVLDPGLCRMQADGECAWSVNSTFSDCLAKYDSEEQLNSTDVIYINTTEEFSETPATRTSSVMNSEGTGLSQLMGVLDFLSRYLIDLQDNSLLDMGDDISFGLNHPNMERGMLSTEQQCLTALEEKLKYPSLNVIKDNSIESFADYVKANKCSKILVLTGAGISTSAGIPDFRSKGSGLYDNLLKYNLPYPEAIFDLKYFKRNPEPFFILAKELFPGNFNPTLSHFFIKLLEQKNLLLRNYTQNIDTLERYAGISSNLIIEAHGSFKGATCVGGISEDGLEKLKSVERERSKHSKFEVDVVQGKTEKFDPRIEKEMPKNKSDEVAFNESEPLDQQKQNDRNTEEIAESSSSEDEINIEDLTNSINKFNLENGEKKDQKLKQEAIFLSGCGKKFENSYIEKKIFNNEIPRCDNCFGLVKPDITFFGEPLPDIFHKSIENDFDNCDLLIVMGTSLQVNPFASLINFAGPNIPRLLINRDKVGELKLKSRGFDFDGSIQKFRRDSLFLGSCDEGCLKFADLMGWKEELLDLMMDHLKFLALKKKSEILKEPILETSAMTAKEEKISEVKKEKEDKLVNDLKLSLKLEKF